MIFSVCSAICVTGMFFAAQIFLMMFISEVISIVHQDNHTELPLPQYVFTTAVQNGILLLGLSMMFSARSSYKESSVHCATPSCITVEGLQEGLCLTCPQRQ